MSESKRLDTWERFTDWPLLILAVLFLGAYAWEVIGNLQGRAASVTELIMNVVWAAFVADYVVRLFLAKLRFKWFITHLFDLLIVALPILRPLRLLRLVTFVKVLGRKAGSTFRGKIALYSVASTALLIFVSALAVLDAERGVSDALITSFPQAIWWGFETITTVGYGDLYPISVTGRAVALCLMTGGVALIGVVTATMASWVVDMVNEKNEQDRAATSAEINELKQQISELTLLVESKR
ncbi:ion channel [uncultured Mobiluncus sp.]|uniref:ion channel n=1 Tax=uncultured Mobiluncus sp. TaxID=293425 RepID=UPI00261270DC|nr:ion channel [uncultured Mobiluncus sp.]